MGLKSKQHGSKSSKSSTSKKSKKKSNRTDSPLSDNDDDSDSSSPPASANTIIYCICRSRDISRFMIGCDKCDEWYHGDCIKVLPSEAKYFDKYYCKKCVEEDPTLHTTYKESKGKASSKAPPKAADERQRRRQQYARDLAKLPEFMKAGAERMQCLNPPCTRVARVHSKYCSLTCGIETHKNALNHRFGRGKLGDLTSTRLAAEQISRRDLDRTRRERIGIQARLEQLNALSTSLDDLTLADSSKPTTTTTEAAPPVKKKEAASRKQRSDSESSSDNDQQQPDPEPSLVAHGSTFCPTCGASVLRRVALRHTERCFKRAESLNTYASTFRAEGEATAVFCDRFNKKEQVYCKRFRTLCPDHFKEKRSDTERCGFRLQEARVQHSSSSTHRRSSSAAEHRPPTHCRELRRECLVHHNWDNISRALIGNDKFQEWMMLEDNVQDEATLRRQMSERLTVPGLLYNRVQQCNSGSRTAEQISADASLLRRASSSSSAQLKRGS